MSIADKTVAQLDAAYKECAKLSKMLEDYHQGTNRPSVQLGRFTVAEVDAQVTATLSAISALGGSGD